MVFPPPLTSKVEKVALSSSSFSFSLRRASSSSRGESTHKQTEQRFERVLAPAAVSTKMLVWVEKLPTNCTMKVSTRIIASGST